MLTDEQIIAKYGEPGDADNITQIELPYPMRIAWDTTKKVSKISCHKLIAQPLLNVFNELLAIYGREKLVELGIDLFGGCVNVRLMRGSKKRWSRHSWGIAIDLDPNRNGLKTKKPAAQFSKPEYTQMNDLFYKHGFIGYGIEKNYDWMHFEINQ
jgi:hypothetical protein